MAYIVYLLTNTVNGKVYVGQTAFTLEKRWREHLRLAFSNKPRKQRLHWAIQKCGAEAFTRTTLITVQIPDELDKLEEQYIQQFDSTDKTKGYNDSTGGGNGRRGVRISEQTRERLRTAWERKKARGYTAPPTFTTKGKEPWNKGKGWSNETLEKQLAHWTPEERREQAKRNAQRLIVGRCTRWNVGRGKPCICGTHNTGEK